MIKKTLLWAITIAIAGGLTYYIVARSLTTEEDRVRNVIEGLIANAESNAGNFAVYRIQTQLTDDFKHHDGRRAYGKDIIIRALSALMAQYTDVRVEVAGLTVQIGPEEETAEVRLSGRVMAAPAGSPGGPVELMTRPGHNRVLIHLIKTNGHWKVNRSELVAHDLKAEAPVLR
jgi:hypothetical protein